MYIRMWKIVYYRSSFVADKLKASIEQHRMSRVMQGNKC